MKFKTDAIISNQKIMANLGDFVYLDVDNNKLYMASDNQALMLKINFEDATESEKVFVISKAEFLHIAQFAEEIELNSDYSFIAGDSKGKFDRNENYFEVLDSIRVMFSQSDSYESLFEVDDNLLKLLTRGSIFVNAEDSREISQNLDIQNGYIFSSSLYRVYLNTFPMPIEGIIHASILKFIFQLGLGTKVSKNRDSFLLENTDVSLYFSSMREVSFLPILSEKFQNGFKNLLEKTKITFNLEELKRKLDFVSFYARKKPSGLTYLNIGADGKVRLLVDENNAVEVETVEIQSGADEGEFNLPFNSISLLEIISKLMKDHENVSLYASTDNSTSKLFLLTFGETETVILSKINAVG